MLRYRLVKKLLSTYIEALPEYVSPDGRIHSSFNQTGTATGRLSSNRPNLQNIPARTDESRMIRSAFVPGEGKTFVSADYSQVELRVLAHFCGDEGLKKAFSEGRDIHSVVASEVFDVPLDEVDKEKRTTAKAVNFGLVYGQGVWGLSNFLDISRKKAKEFIDRYFERFPRVREFKEARIEKAREQGYVTTLGGRRRFIPQLSSSNPRDRAQGERLVINTLVQGSAADLIKVAMIKLNRRILREELPMDLILQIHDELLYEVPRDARESTAEVVKEEMESAMELDVPLEVTVGTGLDWLELK
ncbi:MAG: DNA polymerase [Planctomycetota bacterium]|nr:DNA polymerase [Planctomycetota bacterium]